MNSLKALSFLFACLLSNSIYSAPCGAPWGINASATLASCTYTFTPILPTPPPTGLTFDWEIRSSGSASANCDSYRNQHSLTYQFCFYGLHDVIMTVHNGMTTCEVTIQVNVTCAGAFECDNDPTHADHHPCPLIEISYIDAPICTTMLGTLSGCMYTGIGAGVNDIACGWRWGLRVPPYVCDGIFSYYVEYYDVSNGCDNPGTCTHLALDTTVQCIIAKMGEPIYVVVSGNHCCLPAGFQRAFIWEPEVTNYTPIDAPTMDKYGVCYGGNCPGNSGNCVEDQQQCCLTSGWPAPCFTGGKKTEQRVHRIFEENANIEQNIYIYNMLGVVVFNGKWKFGDPENFNIQWPSDVRSGLYLVKFQNAEKLTKLYKFN